MANRVDDIVSPITGSPLPNKVSLEDAQAAGRFGHRKPTVENSIVLLIDHQIGLLASTRDITSSAEIKSNIIGLARVTKALGIPVMITSSNAQWQNGDVLPEIKELFPQVPIIRRTGIVNSYEDPAFREAFDALTNDTGRRHIILAGVTLGTCTQLPTLSMLNDGYEVYPVIDAAGAWSRYEADAAVARMTQAGAQPVSTFGLACELIEDWKKERPGDLMEPFLQNLSEYGFVAANFWNNYGQKTVADPFA